MHPWVEQVQQALIPLSNADNAAQMKAYMRGQFEFFGIQSTPRREALKPLFAAAQLPSIEQMPSIIDQLYALPEREFQLVAIDLLIKMKKRLPPSLLIDLERWITTKSWWDTVDMIATHAVGALFINHPQHTGDFITAWRANDNIWLRRSALLYQLKYKQRTDVELLFGIILENRNDSEFFIQKAIGCVLREYSKTDASAVVTFIEQQQIEGLARREGLKWLNRNRS